MPPTIAIVTDATCDVPLVERSLDTDSEPPWIVAPEIWNARGRNEIRDTSDTNSELIKFALDSSLRAEVHEPSATTMREIYAQLESIDRIFSIHSPHNVSTTVENAREAAGAYPNVRVIEANVTGIGLGLLAVTARDLAAGGASADDIEDWLRANHDQVRMLVVPDRFDPTATQRGLTTRLLSGRAMLHNTGMGSVKLDKSRRLRSRRATVAAIERYLRNHLPEAPESPQDETASIVRIAVGHGDAAGAIDPFLDLIERSRPDASIVLTGRVGPRLIQQIGARCVAAAWVET